MIEPTPEMIRRIRERIGGSEIAARSAAEAALGLIERDYELRPRSADPTDPEWACPICGYHNRGVCCTHCGAQR